MDGPVVAYDVRGEAGGCNRLFLWDVQTGAGARVRAPRTCEADSTSTGGGVTEVAVAGRRVAWTVSLGGNTESGTSLYTASWPRRGTPVERKVASALATGDVDCVLEGTRLGDVVGDGTLLAFNVWRTVAAAPGASCEERVTRGFLRRIGGRGWSTVAVGPATLYARSASAGRVAVVRDDGTAALVPAAGAAQPKEVAATGVREAALSGDTLVLLTGSRTLEVRDARSGSLRRALTVAPGAAHLDLEAGLAVYAVGRRLHVVSLASGRDVVVAVSPRRIEDAALERPGAVYSTNTFRGVRPVGNLAYLPTAVLRARLR
jgi:hypothetical protein